MNKLSRFLLPIVGLFAILCIIIFSLSGLLARFGIDRNVLLVANCLFLLLNVAIFMVQKKALSHSNPNVFIRTVMGGMMAKMMACAIAVIVYVVAIGSNYDKKAVFIALFIYLVYLAVEVATLMRLNNKKNA